MVERIRILIESRQLTPTQFADIIGVARPIVSHILSGRNKPSLEVVQRILAAMPDLAMPWLLNGTGPMLAGTTAISSTFSEEPTALAIPAAAAALAPVEAEEHRPTVVKAASKAPMVPGRDIERVEKERVDSIAPVAAPLRASTPASGRARVTPKRFVANAAVLDALPQLPDSANAPSRPLAVTTGQPPVVAPSQDATPAPSIPPPTPRVEVADKVVPLQSASVDETPGAALASALFAGGDKPIRRIVIFYRDGSFADYQPE